MKRFTLFSSLLLLIATIFLSTNSSYAQNPEYDYGLNIGGNSFPFNSSASNKVQWLYIMSEFNTPVPGGSITKIYVRKGSGNINNPPVLTNLRVKIGAIPSTMTSFSSPTYLTTEMTEVFFSPSYTGAVGGASTWFGIELDTPFQYDGTSNLVVEISQEGYTNGFSVRNTTINTTDRRIFGNVSSPSGTWPS